MPITVEIVDAHATQEAIDRVFGYFTYVDETFSTFKPTSEISRINAGTLKIDDSSADVQRVLQLCEQTKLETDGYFEIRRPDNTIDPAGLVKGWAIKNAAEILLDMGFSDFYVDAGGDIQPHGRNANEKPWTVGVREPVEGSDRIVKTLFICDNEGVATSGTYLRGQHVRNPKAPEQALLDVVSLTVIGSDVYEADRFATAAFAMGKQGIEFIERLPGFEGYQIGSNGMATMTSGFQTYTHPYA